MESDGLAPVLPLPLRVLTSHSAVPRCSDKGAAHGQCDVQKMDTQSQRPARADRALRTWLYLGAIEDKVLLIFT